MLDDCDNEANRWTKPVVVVTRILSKGINGLTAWLKKVLKSDKSVNVSKIQDKPLFAGALGRNRKRVNNIRSTKNVVDEVETKKLINSYGNKRTVTACGSIVDFVKGCG